MVEFRPHRLRIRSTTGHRDDATGDWIADTESWSDPIPCRYVANGTGQQIKLDDGTFYTFPTWFISTLMTESIGMATWFAYTTKPGTCKANSPLLAPTKDSSIRNYGYEDDYPYQRN